MINIGIIGFGKMGRIRTESLEKTGNVEIIKVYEKNQSEDINYPQAKNYDEVITDPNIDAVVLCLPNNLNFPLTIEALNNGKHVFCEKPPAFTVSEVKEIIKVEKETGKKLMYGFNHRHHDAVMKIRELLDSGEYGKVLWMRGRYGKSVDETYFDNWRSKKELAGGGILLDQGIHMLDLFYI